MPNMIEEVEQGKHTIAFVDDLNMWTYWRIKGELWLLSLEVI